jgi:hypothetical protein
MSVEEMNKALGMNRPELTFEEFCNLPVPYVMGMTFDCGAIRIYRNKDIGLQIEIITKRKIKADIYSEWKPEQRYYFLDNDANQYRTLDQVYVAYMENVCGVKS